MNATNLPLHAVIHGPPVPPKIAAGRLAREAIRGNYKPDALHTYRDASGTPSYWRIRARLANGEKWIRPMRRDGMLYTLAELCTYSV